MGSVAAREPRFERLTDRQREVWQFMVDYLRANKMPPTNREIQEHFGFSSPAASFHYFAALVKKGVVTAGEDGASRRYTPVLPSGCCPLCGAKREGR